MPACVLHVGIGVGSGVLAVIEDYVAATAELDHHVALAADATCSLGADWSGGATTLRELPAQPRPAVRELRTLVERLRPDVVHAHSSLAGVLTRVGLGQRWQRRIVYTPHCYAFHRDDVSRPVRRAFWGAEAVLSLRGQHVVAVSPAEEAAARRLPGARTVRHVPNVARGCPVLEPRPLPAPGQLLRIVTAGRVAPQKDPVLFAAAARRAGELGRPTTWTWVGGGEPGALAQLRDAGVEVTGWTTRTAAQERIAAADLYVHPAAWEGSPITVLEAAALGTPILARRIQAMVALGVAPLFDDADGLLAAIARFPDEAQAAAVRRTTAALRSRHHPDLQRQALLDAYHQAAGRALPLGSPA